MARKRGASAKKNPTQPPALPPELLRDAGELLEQVKNRRLARSQIEQEICEAAIYGRTYAATSQVLIGGIKASDQDDLVKQLQPVAGVADAFASGAVRRYRAARVAKFGTTPAAPEEKKG